MMSTMTQPLHYLILFDIIWLSLCRCSLHIAPWLWGKRVWLWGTGQGWWIFSPGPTNLGTSRLAAVASAHWRFHLFLKFLQFLQFIHMKCARNFWFHLFPFLLASLAFAPGISFSFQARGRRSRRRKGPAQGRGGGTRRPRPLGIVCRLRRPFGSRFHEGFESHKLMDSSNQFDVGHRTQRTCRFCLKDHSFDVHVHAFIM